MILIMADNHAQAQEYAQMIDDFQVEIFPTGPGSVLSTATLSGLFLILATDTEDILLSVFSNQQIPDYIPTLVIGRSATPPLLLQKNTTNRLVDHTALPITREAIRAKIHFLRKVYKLSSERFQQIQDHHGFLAALTSRDGLTGLYNRRHLNTILQDEFQKTQATGSDLSILVLDIDYFNEINKSVGHSYGDFVLNEMSARLTNTTRQEDICFRFSGEDFLILMPGADLNMAATTAEHLRRACANKPFRHCSTTKNVTLSIGVASYNNHHPDSQDEFITMAETALYMAKAEGRNRIGVFTPLGTNGKYSAKKNLESLKITITRILEKTRYSAISSLQLLAKDVGGDEHREHIEMVSSYTQILGKQLGLPGPIIQTFQNALILHTSIRFLLHSDIISKKGKFTKTERQVMRDLPYKVHDITEIFDYFSQERSILLTQSEKFDGSGFPEGLSGDEIPLGARIFNLVDSLAAMNSDRPFRSRLEPQAILLELKNEAGRQFDPFLVLELLDMIQDNRLLNLSDSFLNDVRTDLLNTHPHLDT